MGKRHGSLILALVDRLASCPDLEFLGFEAQTDLTPWAIVRPSIQVGMPYVAGIDVSDSERLLAGLEALAEWLGSGSALLYADGHALPWAGFASHLHPDG